MLTITSKQVVLDQSFETAEEAIAYAGQQLVNLGYVTPDYTQLMQERQQKVSVYIGNFVALPHAEMPEEMLLKEGVFMIQVPDGVNFGTAEKRQVATLIVAVALSMKSQLIILQELALFFSDIKNVQKLSDATEKSSFLAILTDYFGEQSKQ
ncbi:PTS sugar transporter subunit IIA [Enterococcus sp. LJL98]